jgi:uncharacterized protein (UPF0276 family)
VAAAADVVVAVAETRDRFGIGFRPELAAGILSHTDHIDLVEVIADDLFRAPQHKLRAMQLLAAQLPIMLHGVSLGLATADQVQSARLTALARLCEELRPEAWSEHLAFVRSDGVEIGHLAAPPRTDATMEGACRNLQLAHAVVGQRPLVENIASLIEPPGAHDEATWISHILNASNCDLLLDLHNLYANALNFGREPLALLRALPADRIAAVHLAGGRWITASNGERRRLDDHLHDVPDAVYALLEEVGAIVRRPLTVILERDGKYPPFAELLTQLDRARDALSRGRLRGLRSSLGESGLLVTGSIEVDSALQAHASPHPDPAAQTASITLESYLARLFMDPGARERFLLAPQPEAARAGLSELQCAQLMKIDRTGLELAAHSYARKKESKMMHAQHARAWWRW